LYLALTLLQHPEGWGQTVHLYELLAQRVERWRQQGYPHSDYPTIAEILDWAAKPGGAGFRLRPPQVRALETYW